MSNKLSGSSGTGKKILENLNCFQYTLKCTEEIENGKRYEFDVSFENKEGYFNIIVKDGQISEDTIMDIHFKRPLGAYNDKSLIKLAEKLISKLGLKK